MTAVFAGRCGRLSRPVALACAVIFACVTLTACGGGGTAGASPSGVAAVTHSASYPASKSPSPTPTGSPSPSALLVDPGAGKLPQTTARPAITGPQFQAMVSDLWLAVQTGKASYALPAFFPVDAYKQVKAIWSPQFDWRYRLWLDFSLDVKAAHQLLGPDPASARFVKVIVPISEEVWVSPGACYNSTGYWHVGGPRVVYQQNGEIRSFGIASLISWRGVWYVIHFGGIDRGAVGMVDAPATGPGYPGLMGGC